MSAPLRQPIVVVLGHVDSGKCISGDSLLQLADGRLVRAEQAFEQFRGRIRQRLPDGEIYEAKKLELLSVTSDGNTVPSRVSLIWKLSTDTTVTVGTEAGVSLECTPEHMFLTLDQGGRVSFRRASSLKKGDRLLIPSKVNIPRTRNSSLKSQFGSTFSPGTRTNIGGPELPSSKSSTPPGEMGSNSMNMAQCLADQGGSGKHPPTTTTVVSTVHSEQQEMASLTVKLPGTKSGLPSFFYSAGFLAGIRARGGETLSEFLPIDLRFFWRTAVRVFGEGSIWLSQNADENSLKGLKKAYEDLSRCLISYNSPSHEESQVLTPELLSAFPKVVRRRFLQGVFDALGIIDPSKGVVIPLNNCLRNTITVLLLCLGTVPKVSPDDCLVIQGRENIENFKDNVGFAMPSKKRQLNHLLQQVYNHNSPTTIGIQDALRPSAESTSLLASGPVGSASEVAQALLGEGHPSPGLFPPWPGAGFQGKLEGFAYVTVASVKENRGMRTVYDFTVDKFHNFLANGLVVHNTSLLDRLRGTAVQSREAGGITQQIGASFFPPETLIKICGPLLKMFGGNVEVPGLLVIDTPGHEAFANLRSRGGSAADIAILVVDSTKGLEAQTLESIDILRSRKVPFVIALSKIDLLAGWRPDPNRLIKDVASRLDPVTVQLLDDAIYRVVGQLSQLGFASEAYYRVKDFTREVSIVPVSSKTGEGIAELLTIVVGLSQQYLAKRLKVAGTKTRGIVLEVKEEPGLGPTINVILVDGTLKVGSRVVVAKRDSAQVVKIRALLLPKPLDEMRDPRDRFESVEEIAAAAGVKLSAPDLDGVLAGSPLIGLSDGEDEEEAKRQVMSEVKSAIFETEELGIILKADTLGALEALSGLLKKQGIPVRTADIGPVTKRDIIQASSVMQDDRYLGVVLAFNVKVLEDAEQEAQARGVKIFNENVIYTLIDSYTTWVSTERENEARAAFSSMTLPCKFKIMKGFVFRRNNPAVFGVEVLVGKLKQKSKVMNSRGEEVGSIQQIQHEGQDMAEAQAGEKVAVSMKEPTVGRQVKEGEDLYTLPESDHARLLMQKYADRLTREEMDLLKEIISIRRRVHATYAF